MIRPFTPEDGPVAMQLCHELHEESSYSFLPFVEEKIFRMFREAVDRPEDRLFLVAERDGEIVGIFYAVLNPYYFCDEKIAAERWVYVRKEHRGTLAATGFIKRFIKWAREKDAAEVQVAPSTGIQTERTVEWLKSLGFEVAGVTAKLRL